MRLILRAFLVRECDKLVRRHYEYRSTTAEEAHAIEVALRDNGACAVARSIRAVTGRYTADIVSARSQQS